METARVWAHVPKRGGGGSTASQLALPVGVEDDGEVRLYRLALPYLPPSKNVAENWPREWRAGMKHKWERDIGRLCEEMAIPKGVRKIGLAAVLVFPTKARRDPQNYAQYLWHWVPDALQKAGVIDGDHEGKIEIPTNWGLKFQIDSRQTVPKKRREHTIIAMTMLVDGKK